MLSVTTCPRPVSYFPETIRNLDENGADLVDEKWICTDGLETLSKPNNGPHPWFTHTNAQRTGQRLAMWRVFQLAVNRKADWLIYCEDDIVVAKDAIKYIAGLTLLQGESSCAFETFFDARMTADGAKHGWQTFPLAHPDRFEYFCGALCLLIRKEVIAYLANCDPLDAPQFIESFHSGDCVMAHHLSKSPWPNYAVHVPSLVDHRGDASSIVKSHPMMPVRARNYAGERDDVWKMLHKPFHSK